MLLTLWDTGVLSLMNPLSTLWHHLVAPPCWLQCTKDRLERMQEKLSKTQLEKLGLDQKVGTALR